MILEKSFRETGLIFFTKKKKVALPLNLLKAIPSNVL